MKAKNKTNDINKTVDQLRAGAHSAVDKTANATVHAAEVFSGKSEQLKNAEEQYMDQVRHYIYERPFASFGLAMGVGFLINRLLSDR